MNTIYNISSLYSATWVAWLLLVLLVLLIINPSARIDLLFVLRNAFSYSERSYNTQTCSWISKMVSCIFGVGVIGLGVYILVKQGVEVSYMTYFQVLGVVTLVYFLQLLLVYGVGYVFLSPKKMANAMEQYRGIRATVPLLLYPILLLVVNCYSVWMMYVLYGLIILVFMGMLMAKLWMLFGKNLWSILYIILYVVFLEIIPMVVIFSWTKKLVAL